MHKILRFCIAFTIIPRIKHNKKAQLLYIQSMSVRLTVQGLAMLLGIRLIFRLTIKLKNGEIMCTTANVIQVTHSKSFFVPV